MVKLFPTHQPKTTKNNKIYKSVPWQVNFSSKFSVGITSYGYSPFVYAPGEFSGVHGNDERLGVENLKKGVRTLYQLLVDFAVQP